LNKNLVAANKREQFKNSQDMRGSVMSNVIDEFRQQQGKGSMLKRIKPTCFVSRMLSNFFEMKQKT
jgi:hypothetical protein